MNNLTDSVQFDNFDPRASIGMIASPQDFDAQIYRMLAKIDAFSGPSDDYSLQGEMRRAQPPVQYEQPYEVQQFPAPRPLIPYVDSASYTKVLRLEREIYQFSLYLAQLRNQFSSSYVQIEQLRIEKTGLQNVIEQKDGLITQLKYQYNELQQANRDLRETTQDAVYRACILREEKTRLDADYRGLEYQIEQLKLYNAELEAQLQTQSQLEGLIRERNEIYKKDQYYVQIYDFLQQISDLSAVVSQKDLIIKDLITERDSLRNYLVSLQDAGERVKTANYSTVRVERDSVEYTPQVPRRTSVIDGYSLNVAQLATEPEYMTRTVQYMSNAEECDQLGNTDFYDPQELTNYRVVKIESPDRPQEELTMPQDPDNELMRYTLQQTVPVKPETPLDIVQRRQREFLEHQRERARSAERARQQLESQKEVIRSARATNQYEPAAYYHNQDRIKQVVANHLLGGEANYLRRITTLDEMAGQSGHLVVVLKSVATCGYYAVVRVQNGELIKISGPEQMPMRLPFDKIESYLRWNTAGKRFEVLNQRTMGQRVDAVTLNVKRKGTDRSQMSYLSYADTL